MRLPVRRSSILTIHDSDFLNIKTLLV
jgi:hypothetical protein